MRDVSNLQPEVAETCRLFRVVECDRQGGLQTRIWSLSKPGASAWSCTFDPAGFPRAPPSIRLDQR